MPDALFFDRPKEALDHAVLFWSIGSDKLLGEVIGGQDRAAGQRGQVIQDRVTGQRGQVIGMEDRGGQRGQVIGIALFSFIRLTIP